MTDTSAWRVQRGRIKTTKEKEIARLLVLARQGDKKAIWELEKNHGTIFKRKVTKL